MAKETIDVKFLHSPTGKFGLGYNAGETGPVAVALASEIIESGYGEASDSKALKKLEGYRAEVAAAADKEAAEVKTLQNKSGVKEAAEIIADAKNDAESIVNGAKAAADEYGKSVIDDAKKQAETIITDAETILKEAKEMAEKIISEAAAKEAAAKDVKVNGAQTVETATDKGAATAEKS